MIDLPRGTVTFLFTDIERSTRLWHDHPEAMARALARHDDLVADAIAAAGGVVFKHTGDGLCAAFSEPAGAIAGAIAVQSAVTREDWGGLGPLRVRVALHTGAAQVRERDYFGPTLSRVARVLSVGHGGQILATAATVGLIPGAATRDLGLHRLRDLSEPVHLFQVEAEGLARTFPPLASLEQFQHSLPVQRSSFVGREREVEEVGRLLERARLLTVTGVGGCGKTRLALAAGAHALDRFRDGAFFVDLSVLSDASLVWGVVAEAIQLPALAASGPGPEVTTREVVLRHLAPCAALVILDNCEHLVDECASLVDALLERCPALRVLSTSREPLGVEGEQVFRLPSLALPRADGDPTEAEAVRLFVDRATAADAGFRLDADSSPAVVEICERLDGMPLAIELAASRVSHLSPAQIVARLDDRFRLLAGGRRGARPRQQTLQAAIDWSHDLLGERERTLLRRLAVFVGGFTLEDAEGVCAGDGLVAHEVVGLVGALVDKSLVSLHAAEGRYRLLETIRLYAQDRLVIAGEARALRDRHCEWFLRLGETAPPRAWQPWLSDKGPLGAELENLRAARAWAHEIGDADRVARLSLVVFEAGAAATTGGLEEASHWCEVTLAVKDIAPHLRADTLAVSSMVAIAPGDWTVGAEQARSAIALAARHSGTRLTPVAYWALLVALSALDPDEADRVADECIEHLRRAPSPAFPLGLFFGSKMDTMLMRHELERTVEFAHTFPADANGFVDFTVSVPLHLLGDHAGAETRAHAQLARSGGLPFEYAPRLVLALALAARGRWPEAAEELRDAAAIVRRYRFPLTLNDCVVVCGALAALEGDLERASRLLACAVEGTRAVRTPAMWAIYRHYRALVRRGLDAATVRRCREAGRGLGLEEALDQEVRRRTES